LHECYFVQQHLSQLKVNFANDYKRQMIEYVNRTQPKSKNSITY